MTTVLFLLGLRWLPKRIEADDPRVAAARAAAPRRATSVLAVAGGAGLAALSYAMLTRPAPQSISPFFLERALPEGGGTNVVNVMLVDFRSFDTLGEITVLGRGGAHRVCAAAAFPAAAREHRAAAAAAARRVPDRPCATDLVARAPRRHGGAATLMVPAVLVRLAAADRRW